MSKDNTRDYAVWAFRLYAIYNQPTQDEIYKIAMKNRTENSIANMLDLLAVDKTLTKLNNTGKDYICKAIKNIYFFEPQRRWRKGEINNRVLHFAAESYTDERTVFRWIKEAQLLFAHFRGLNIIDPDMLLDD